MKLAGQPMHPPPHHIYGIDFSGAQDAGKKIWIAEGIVRPLQNVHFCPISASDSNFNPRNTQCIPVVKIFAFLDLEQN